MSGCFFFDPFASPARLADAGGIAAPRLLEFLLPPSDRRAAQSRDDRQVLDPSSTVGCRPEAGKQSSPSLIQGGDQKIDGPMLLDDLAPETSLAIRTTTDMDRWGWGPGFHGSPLSCERKEVSLIVPRNQSTYSWPAPHRHPPQEQDLARGVGGTQRLLEDRTGLDPSPGFPLADERVIQRRGVLADDKEATATGDSEEEV